MALFRLNCNLWKLAIGNRTPSTIVSTSNYTNGELEFRFPKDKCKGKSKCQGIGRIHSSSLATANYKFQPQALSFASLPLSNQVILVTNSIRMASTMQTPKPTTDESSSNDASKVLPQEDKSAASLSPQKDERSTKEKLKQAVRDYGATVIVFHVSISLMSLGFFYLLVSSGLDVVAILEKVGISGAVATSKVTEEASKFVVAYAIHKVFAPLRIAVTLGVTPLIVRKLRKIGILKQVVKTKKS